MDAEVEAAAVRTDDCHAQQSTAVSLPGCDEQLQRELDAVEIRHRDVDDENTDRSLNGSAVTDSNKLSEIDDCETNERVTEIQYISCSINYDNNRTSAGLKDVDPVSCETNIAVKDAETERCLIEFDAAKDDESADCLAGQHAQLAGENDDPTSDVLCGQTQNERLVTSECPECNEATPDAHQLGDISSDKDLGQCFTIASQSQTHCTADSLQDAFLQFLRRKQVS